MKVDTTKESINHFLTRGLEAVFPNKEMLEARLSTGTPLTVYLGVDPTGPTLHLGHMIPLIKLAELQKMGHKIIFLIGDFTAMIGDPTDKGTARKRLTREEVLANLTKYKEQASNIISFEGDNAAEVRFNSSWLGKMTFADVVELAAHITVDQMAKRDMFARRAEEGKPVYLHEFLYPLMQGYDSVAMDVDGEIGGNDQTFNMLAGRDLMKEYRGKDKFVIATKLLVDPNGKKMGKTEGNMVALSDSPRDMFGKVMSWTDGMILPGFELATKISTKEIEEIKKALDDGMNPRDAKIRLAKEMVAMFYGKNSADEAEKNFLSAFSEKGVPDDVLPVTVPAGMLLSDILLELNLVASKGEFRRLIDEGAVSIVGGAKITDPYTKITESADYKIGKHRFFRAVVQK